MGEELTRELPEARSFEERVFARFDAMDSRFNSIEGRFVALDARFDAVDARFDAVDVRFDAVDVRFDAVDVRFDAVDVRFDAVDARFDAVEARLDGLDGRVQALEAKALDTKPIWERALAEILEVRKGVEDLDRKFDLLTLDVMQVRADQRRVEKRMDELETRIQ